MSGNATKRKDRKRAIIEAKPRRTVPQKNMHPGCSRAEWLRARSERRRSARREARRRRREALLSQWEDRGRIGEAVDARAYAAFAHAPGETRGPWRKFYPRFLRNLARKARRGAEDS